MPAMFGRAPSRPHAAMVLGREGFQARLRHSPTACEDVPLVVEVGEQVRRHLDSSQESQVSGQFDRSARLFGSAGQATLQGLCVAIVGLGGTGSIVAQHFAYLGVGRLLLMDNDLVDLTSLNRLVGATERDVGRAKVDVIAHQILRISPRTKVTSIRGSALRKPDATPLLTVDFIICCTDTHGSRAVINQIAYQYLIPVIDVGVRIDAPAGQVKSVSGRVQMLAPGLACLVCQGLLDSEAVRRDLLSEEERRRDPYIVGAVEPQPSVISLNGTVSSLAVTMFLAATLGLPLQARHQIYLADRGVVRAVESSPLPDCVVCSLRGSLARGDLWTLPWRTD